MFIAININYNLLTAFFNASETRYFRSITLLLVVTDINSITVYQNSFRRSLFRDHQLSILKLISYWLFILLSYYYFSSTASILQFYYNLLLQLLVLFIVVLLLQ